MWYLQSCILCMAVELRLSHYVINTGPHYVVFEIRVLRTLFWLNRNDVRRTWRKISMTWRFIIRTCHKLAFFYDKYYLFILTLFNYTFSSSDKTSWNQLMINKHRILKLQTYFHNYPGICLVELRKTTEKRPSRQTVSWPRFEPGT